MMEQERKLVLYVIVCAAPPAREVPSLLPLLQQDHWDTYIIATPQATRWIDVPILTELSGHPIRTDYKLPDEADPFPKADAVLAVPVTFNTINKWAGGIGDTLATSILCEYLGGGKRPIVAVPCLKMDLVKHPAFLKNIAVLQEYGVHILHEPERYPSPKIVPWDEIVKALHHVIKGTKNENI